MRFELLIWKVASLCVFYWDIVKPVQTSPASVHPPHFESISRNKRTVDLTLPRLGDLQPGAVGVLNQHCTCTLRSCFIKIYFTYS